MNSFLKYLNVAPIYLICSCETDIVFTESQPSGIESQTVLPEKFIGPYMMDVEKMSEMKNESIPKNIPAEAKRPFLIITADSIFFLEYRYDELHENFVDGVSYELRNNYLFRDDKQISIGPVEKKGDMYVYETRIDSFPISVQLDTFRFEMGEKDTAVGFTQIKFADNYFVLNLFLWETKYWASFYFGLISENQLVIKIGLGYDDINYTKMKAITKTERTTDKYILSPKDNLEFKKVTDIYFKELIYLKKIN